MTDEDRCEIPDCRRKWWVVAGIWGGGSKVLCWEHYEMRQAALKEHRRMTTKAD